MAKEGIGRRSFLKYSIGALAGFGLAAAGIPVLGSFLSPITKKKGKGVWIELGNVGDFGVGKPRLVEFTLTRRDGWMEYPEPKSVWVVRQGEREFTLFNPRCTHLGCLVDWKEGSKGLAFYSPCHAGVFALDGRVISGPPPRALDNLNYRLEGERLVVEYLDFRVGIPQKVPI